MRGQPARRVSRRQRRCTVRASGNTGVTSHEPLGRCIWYSWRSAFDVPRRRDWSVAGWLLVVQTVIMTASGVMYWLYGPRLAADVQGTKPRVMFEDVIAANFLAATIWFGCVILAGIPALALWILNSVYFGASIASEISIYGWGVLRDLFHAPLELAAFNLVPARQREHETPADRDVTYGSASRIRPPPSHRTGTQTVHQVSLRPVDLDHAGVIARAQARRLGT